MQDPTQTSADMSAAPTPAQSTAPARVAPGPGSAPAPMDVVASGAGARPSQPETSGSLLGAPRPAAAAREANPTPPSVEGLPPLEPGSDNDAAPAPSTNSASAPLTSGATGTSAPAGTSATSTDVGTAAPAATAAATTNNTTSPTPNETGPKLLHIVARFANGKRFSGALVGTGPSCRLRWRSSGGESYDWKKSISAGAAASSSGGVGTPSLLGRWFDVVSAPVIIGRNRMEKPGCANSMWFPATVLLLTGAEHTRIIVRFAGAAGPARGVVDADSKRILWVGDPAGSTADFCWTRSTAPADGNIFGDWLDEKNNPVSLSPSAASGVGQKYPARVEEIKNAASGAPVPVPRSKNRKKKYLPTRRRSRGGLPSGIDIVATFANGVRLDGKILDQGEKISWRGDRLGPYMWTRTLATAQQQGDVTQVSNKEGIDWKTDAKGVWYDAAKLPVRITANQITGPANPWYPAKLTSLSPLYGGPEPPPATKLKEQKRPSKKAARPQALALLRSGSSGLASPASGAGAPDIVLRFKNGLEMQGWLDRSGAKLTLYPQRYVWRRADDARSGVIGRWHDASMCVVVVGPDAVQGPNKAWYPAKVIATSDAATPASTSTVRSGAPTLTVPTRYQGLSIPRDILQMDAVKARREAAAIRAQIRALDRRYEECRQELGQAGVSVPPAVKKRKKPSVGGSNKRPRVESAGSSMGQSAGGLTSSSARREAKEVMAQLREITRKEKVKKMSKIVRNVMQLKDGNMFSSPVDPIRLGIPTYFQVIKNPMDLGTILKRLASGFYENAELCAADVRLTFDNAVKFNKPGHFVSSAAQRLLKSFEAKYAKMLANADAEIAALMQ